MKIIDEMRSTRLKAIFPRYLIEFTLFIPKYYSYEVPAGLQGKPGSFSLINTQSEA